MPHEVVYVSNMACYYPITIKREGRHELVPCGRCIACILRKRADWSFRLQQEYRDSKSSYFVTLTYEESNLPKNRNLDKKQIQDYLKRVRSECKELKYYLVGEYGSQFKRPHYHAIIFNATKSAIVRKWCKPSTDDEIGFVKIDVVNDERIAYVTGYVIEKNGEFDENTASFKGWTEETLRPFALMSKGLGKRYLKYATKFHKSNFTTEMTKEDGVKQIMPRYYRDKIFTKEEKKVLNEINQEKQKVNELDVFYENEKRKYKKIMSERQIKKRKSI